MKKFIYLAIFCVGSHFGFAQNEVLLANRQKMRIKGKKVSSGQYQDQYLHETADTLYYFQYNHAPQTLVEVRMPLRFFSKQNSKNYKAEINFNTRNSFASFIASNLLLQKTPNEFSKFYYGFPQIPTDDLHTRVGVRFDDKKEGAELIKRVKNQVRQMK